MPDKPEENNSPDRANDRVNLCLFLGRIVGGFVGLSLGVIIGIWIGGSLGPIIGSALGLLAGVSVSQLILKSFPALAANQTISIGVAGYGSTGLIVGWVIGDLLGTFTTLDRSYSGLIGAALGLYIGILIGMAYKRK
jgi:hypothetical protein